jgi:hypothetical protein
MLMLLLALSVIYVFNVLPNRTMLIKNALDEERRPNFDLPHFNNVRVQKRQEIIEDEHVRNTELKERKRLAQRVAMGPCLPVYGKVDMSRARRLGKLGTKNFRPGISTPPPHGGVQNLLLFALSITFFCRYVLETLYPPDVLASWGNITLGDIPISPFMLMSAARWWCLW